MMSRQKYFSRYQSPNIVIVPTILSTSPPSKKVKIDNSIIYETIKPHKYGPLISVSPKDPITNKKQQTKIHELGDLSNKQESPAAVSPEDVEINKAKTKNRINLKTIRKDSNKTVKINSSAFEVRSRTSNLKELLHNTTESTNIKNVNDFECNNVTVHNKIQTNATFVKKINSETELDDYNHNTHLNIKCGISHINKSIKNNEQDNTYQLNNNSKQSNLKDSIDKIKFNKTMEKSEMHIEKDFRVQNKLHNKVEKYYEKKTKTQRKIKTIINVVCNNSHSIEDINKNEIANSELDESNNVDLSFLDDFDIDEVVESLYSYKSVKENTLDPDRIIDSRLENQEKINIPDENHKAIVIKQNSEIERNIEDLTKSKGFEREDKKKEESCLQSNLSQHIEDRIPTMTHQDNDMIKTNVTSSTCEGLTLVSKNCAILDSICDKEGLQNTEKPKEIKEISEDLKMEDSTICTQKNNLNNNNIQQGNKQVESINGCSLRKKSISRSAEILAQELETKMYNNFKEKYSVIDLINTGKFSKIFKCIKSNGKPYAVKTLNKQSDHYSKGKSKEKMLKQVQKDIPLQNLSCIFLIRSFQLKGHWCFLTDYYPTNMQQFLKDQRKSFHVDQIRHLAIQLVEAVIILRNNNIIHSDIKPKHILFDSELNKLKLCGFDEAYYYLRSNNLSANIGTVNYRSPEVILGYSCGFSVDIWSMALVIYEMATNSMLFPGKTNNDILFTQMCIFGNLPIDMIMNSRYKTEHFNGTAFVKKLGLGTKNTVIVDRFIKCDKISSTIFSAYDRDWSKIRSTDEKKDTPKLQLLCRLLEKMLVLNPKHRLAIEFVYANPFFSAK